MIAKAENWKPHAHKRTGVCRFIQGNMNGLLNVDSRHLICLVLDNTTARHASRLGSRMSKICQNEELKGGNCSPINDTSPKCYIVCGRC